MLKQMDFTGGSDAVTVAWNAGCPFFLKSYSLVNLCVLTIALQQINCNQCQKSLADFVLYPNSENPHHPKISVLLIIDTLR